MERTLFKNEDIEFFQLDKETVFNCAHCGQMGHEAPVRSKTKKGMLKTYHPYCADAVIYRLKFGAPEKFSNQSITKVSPTSEPTKLLRSKLP